MRSDLPVTKDLKSQLALPSEIRERTRPTIYLNNGLGLDDTFAPMIQHLNTNNYLDPCYIRYLKNAYVLNDVVFTFDGVNLLPFEGNWRSIDQPSRGAHFMEDAQRLFREQPLFEPSIGLFVGSAGSPNYGHWLVDDLPRLSVFIHSQEHEDIKVVLSAVSAGIDEAKRQGVMLYPEVGKVEFIDRHLFRLFPEIAFVDPVSYHPIMKSKKAIDRLVEDVKNKMSSGVRPRHSGSRFFIDRLSGGTRSIKNMPQLERVLSRNGIKLVSPEKMSFVQQVALFGQAELIIGSMGAGMTNVIFCDAGVSILFLAPDGWHEPFYWDLCDTRGLKYNVLRGKISEQDAASAMVADFEIDLDVFERVLGEIV